MAKSFLNIAGYPIGLRNNNPGNLRPGDQWKGMIGINQNFVVFENIGWGLRALGKDLTTKINSGYSTIELILFRYAPPDVDNNHTLNYIASVVRDTGIKQNVELNPDRETLAKLMRGIVNFENGREYGKLITDADIQEGLDMVDGVSSSPVGPVGFTMSAMLLIFVLMLLVTMPKKNKK